jgi:glycosidase
MINPIKYNVMKKSYAPLTIHRLQYFVVLLMISLLVSCQPATKQTCQGSDNTPLPDWAKNAVIYEVNVRQYTPEGTFNAFSQHLQRLSDMGVDILWIMPIHPIGEKNRKGSLGSYYSVKDYQLVNPDFGTLDDFKKLVEKAHQLKMKVIIDWVANHTAWDNHWIVEHPNWYVTDSIGNLKSPYDWTDVAQLNYDNVDMQNAMIESMKYWLVNADIDGFRCDVAGMVPTPFWNKARAELETVKPIFMLAEDERKIDLLQHAFNANYGWSVHATMNQIVKKQKTAIDLRNAIAAIDTTYPCGSFAMQFISNHDENSWNGSEYERMGDASKLFSVFTFTAPGMPLIYTGQEAGMTKRLRFFDKDTVVWGDCALSGFYKQLTQLKKDNPALQNGSNGGKLEFIETSIPIEVLAYSRTLDNNKVVTLLNCSADTVSVTVPSLKGSTMTNYFSNEITTFDTDKFVMNPWQYEVYIAK